MLNVGADLMRVLWHAGPKSVLTEAASQFCKVQKAAITAFELIWPDAFYAYILACSTSVTVSSVTTTYLPVFLPIFGP